MRETPRIGDFKLATRPDTVDFRDKMYVPTLIEVPEHIDVHDYLRYKIPVLHQGDEGSCTGFGLATVVHYLLTTRKVDPDKTQVSPRMLYEGARKFDEWPGENYEGSSPRGAVKGWHKFGVCADELWDYTPGEVDKEFTPQRLKDARNRPLGAYFRVNHRDIVAMHSAITETGILYVSAMVHTGWTNPPESGRIQHEQEVLGGHAFAIVAYDSDGFWLQNSWGTSWGKNGLAHISYDDWLQNGRDVWVARLGAPIELRSALTTSRVIADGGLTSGSYSFDSVRPHIISIGNEGRLRPEGTFGTSEADIKSILSEDFSEITADWNKMFGKKRLLLYAHGGLVDESAAIQRVADYKETLLNHGVYPIAFIWKTDFWTTLKNIIQDALSKRKVEGLLDKAKDFMLDRLDDALEPLARAIGGKLQWDEMKENALLSSTSKLGGAFKTAKILSEICAEESVEIHVAGHSAGSIFLAPLVQLLTSKDTISTGPCQGLEGFDLKIATCTLWAPACRIDLFKTTYLPAIDARGIDQLTIFNLTDEAEQDDHCANIYHKSLLYLVSNAFEATPRIPIFREQGERLLGLERHIQDDSDQEISEAIRSMKFELVLTPSSKDKGVGYYSTATHHGDFDDDQPTLLATLSRILGNGSIEEGFAMHKSAASRNATRQKLI